MVALCRAGEHVQPGQNQVPPRPPPHETTSTHEALFSLCWLLAPRGWLADALMSTLLSSLIIDPVVRQARRFSGAQPVPPVDARRLSHANATATATATSPLATPTTAVLDDGGHTTAARDEDVPQTDAVLPVAPTEAPSSSAHFIRRAQSAVADGGEQADGNLHDAPLSLSTAEPTARSNPIAIRADPGMSSNPTPALETQFQRLELSPSALSAASDTTQSATSRAAGQDARAMAESLPADDGMRHLRVRIHEIRDMKIADEEKARMMHGLMTERYHFLRPTSPSSFISNDRPFTPTSGQSVFSEAHLSSPVSTASEVDPENPFNLRPGDELPTYRARSNQPKTDENGEDEDFETDEDGTTLGCQHYKRNVKVQCHYCRRWHTCRHCHDAVEDHNLDRQRTQNMLCMACGTPQKAGEFCVECGTQAACYYCDICKLWDDNSSKKIYHCIDCGICRRGAGLGKDYIHCKKCNVCISIAHATTHKCLERATDCDCPICGDYLFDSASAVVSLPCGHYLHKGCYNLYMETAYKCPVCKKSAVNMELQWRKLTQAIESQPMPDQFEQTRAVIQCNDCSAKSSVKYHWLGNKCGTCDSYNTNELRILNGPESEQAANAMLQAPEASLRPPSPSSPASVAAVSPSSQPLRSPRYYFQPDQPEETWLPGSLPFQFPQFPQLPNMPRFPDMPQMPQFPVQFPATFPQFPVQFPGMPQFPVQLRDLPRMPNLPQMPQMPDPYELLERVSRVFSQYLDTSGEVSTEDVPIIDLGDDRREAQATDGSIVHAPSLPQYVLERFSRSMAPLRNYLNPASLDQIPRLDLNREGDEDPDGLQFWGEDGGRLHRALSREENDDEESEESSSSDESIDEEEEDEGEGEGDKHEFELPGHR
ncbi:hypothetical protein BDV96DRAFT_570560 [Lophiotrema nucula]|uniref:CHY zinc finger-domain-containing protein n=1 Tax=Lophiotrema nucula TaxID=690887 RepID=A0A6A5ZGW4_9PLEO|nr:hypothetical protein BDV96DRAFT_570560 [Lophiotrema nucula]